MGDNYSVGVCHGGGFGRVGGSGSWGDVRVVSDVRDYSGDDDGGGDSRLATQKVVAAKWRICGI